jgi:secreted trypsin-like serine protease
LKYIFIICFIGFAHTASAQETQQRLIFGGQVVSANEVAALSTVALFGIDGRVHCSAVLISERAVLTAAHCVEKSGMDLVFSNNVVNGFVSKNKREVIDYRINPGYVDNVKDDIAILYFDGGLVEKYTPALLPTPKYPISIGEKLLAVGYGTSKPKIGFEGTGILRKANLSVLALSYVSKLLLLDQSQGSGVCYGDSGSPLYQVQADGSLMVVGIADTVEKSNCKPKSYYAMVSEYLTWIQKAL